MVRCVRIAYVLCVIDMEADKLNSSIQHIQTKLNEVQEIKLLVEQLEKTGKVIVDNPDDSHTFSVRTRQDEVTDAMVKLSQMGLGGRDIVYDYENDEYKLKLTWRTDR